MKLPDFIINCAAKYGVQSKESLADFEVQLSSYYHKFTTSIKNKMTKKEENQQKLNAIENELNTLDEHTPEYEKKIFEFQKIKNETELTFIEKVISIFEHPLSKLGLMIAFILFSRWMAKKIMKADEPDEEEPEYENPPQNPHQNFNPYYNPYGWYPPSPMNQPPPLNNQQRRNY